MKTELTLKEAYDKYKDMEAKALTKEQMKKVLLKGKAKALKKEAKLQNERKEKTR